MANTHVTPSSRQLPAWVPTAFQWLAVVNAVLMVAQAFLASEGLWGGSRTFLTGHQHLGNAVFALVAIQGVLAFVLASSGQLPRGMMLLGGLTIVLVVAQIGLGYSTRSDIKLTVYHVTNGVLLMGVLAAMAAVAWMRTPARPAR